ncbi:MAG: hypothetical protein ABL921_34100 [Pirellula sp.]
MTRIRYRHLIGLALLLPFFTLSNVFEAPTSADEKSNVVEQSASTKLIGTWKLEKAENPGSPSGIGTRLKMFTGTHWCVIQPDAAGKIVFLHGGTYEFDGSDLKTTTDFAGDKTSMLLGKAGSVKLEIEGDVLKQIDPKGVYNETWRRVTKPGTN